MSALLRHNVRQSGQGRPLVFAHGYGCDQNVWRFVASAFAAQHRIVLMDCAGCGGAAAGVYDFERHASLDGHAQDLIAVCDEAALDKPVVIAHSVSAMVGVLAARRRPELFGALVLLAPSPCYLNDGDYRGGFEAEDIEGLLEMLDANHFGWARMMAPVIMGNADRPELADELGGNFCRMDQAVAKHFARVTFLADHRADLGDVTVPTLVMQCSDDALAPPEVGDYLVRRLPAATLATLQATGHCPHMSAPAETVDVVRDFLRRLAAPQAQSAPRETAVA